MLHIEAKNLPITAGLFVVGSLEMWNKTGGVGGAYIEGYSRQRVDDSIRDSDCVEGRTVRGIIFRVWREFKDLVIMTVLGGGNWVLEVN